MQPFADVAYVLFMCIIGLMQLPCKCAVFGGCALAVYATHRHACQALHVFALCRPRRADTFSSYSVLSCSTTAWLA
jgi:hypothetical protein